MKNIKTFGSFVALMLLTATLFSQTLYTVERDNKDTSKYRFCTYIINAQGAYSKNCTNATSPDTLVNTMLEIASQKKNIIESKELEKDFNRLDSALKNTTGKVYADYVYDSAKRSLQGEWNIINADSTIDMSITIDKDLKVKGGLIKGLCTIENPSKIVLSNVLDADIAFIAKQNQGLIGEYKGKAIRMEKVKTK